MLLMFLPHTTCCCLYDNDVSVTWDTCYVSRMTVLVRRNLIAMAGGSNTLSKKKQVEQEETNAETETESEKMKMQGPKT